MAKMTFCSRLGSNVLTRKSSVLLLAFPFLVVIILTKGLVSTVPTFHGDDEAIFHYPIIQKFIVEFPEFSLSSYHSATTPLFHIVMAAAGKILGYELYKLRLLNVLFSYLAVVLLFRLLVNQMGTQVKTALVYSTLFLLSPYFFGASFRLFTDNLSLVFCLSSLTFMYSFWGGGRFARFLLGCASLSCAILTRQTYLWLVGVALFVLARQGIPRNQRIVGLLAIFLALSPFLYLLFLWKGFVPPEFSKQYSVRTLINVEALEFLLALVGLYGLWLNAANLRHLATSIKSRWPILILGAACLIVFPISYVPGRDGILWRLSGTLPKIFSTGLLFWLLVPAAVLWIYDNLVGSSRRVFWLVVLGCCGFSFLWMQGPLFQKYFDVFALFVAIVLTARSGPLTKEEVAVSSVLALLFLGYAVYPWLIF
jgi:hypothetical protein